MDVETEIRTELKPLIEKWKKRIYIARYVKNVSDAEALGVIMSKYLKWNGTDIFRMIDSVLEDANYHDLGAKFSDLVDGDAKAQEAEEN